MLSWKVILVIKIVWAIALGYEAKARGRSWVLGFALGFCLGLIGLVVLMLLPKKHKSFPKFNESLGNEDNTDAVSCSYVDALPISEEQKEELKRDSEFLSIFKTEE